MNWKDISVELERTYTFPGGEKVTIFGPTRLAVSDSGGHRIVDAANHGHYIPPKWIHIEWIVPAGADPVVA
jgi:hypothetical protein